jgi:hypothetical protein
LPVAGQPRASGERRSYIKGLTRYRYGDESDWYELFTDALRSAAGESVAFGERVTELQDRWREFDR